ncbi:MAG: hypothetical protein J6Y24_04740 [Bacteroidales bacterium]|nr:hypothetical protein [Bacteroidales bacterium]
MDLISSYLTHFSDRGGEFLIPLSDFILKAREIRCIAFDWDGVYNSGVKGEGVYSYFSEVDSMGLNILRFGAKIVNGEILKAGIISGEKNPSTEKFVNREHLNFKCLGFKNKTEGLKHVLDTYGLKPEQVAFVFDDILDLSIAKVCGLRFQVSRNATPMFNNYVKTNNLADYITANTGEHFAVREVCELLLAALNVYNRAVDSRVAFDNDYAQYIAERNSIVPTTFSPKTEY